MSRLGKSSNVASFLSGPRRLLSATRRRAVSGRFGRTHGRLIRQPVLVFTASEQDLGRTVRRAIERGLSPAIYTRSLFATNNDTDNRGAVAVVPTEALDLVGLGLYADPRDIDKVTKGLALHP
jgi:hypothetical protein